MQENRAQGRQHLTKQERLQKSSRALCKKPGKKNSKGLSKKVCRKSSDELNQKCIKTVTMNYARINIEKQQKCRREIMQKKQQETIQPTTQENKERTRHESIKMKTKNQATKYTKVAWNQAKE